MIWRAWVSTYQSEKDRNPASIELSCLEDLYTLLEPEEVDCGPNGCPGKGCPNKDGLSWSPGYVPLGKTRSTGSVESLSVAVFDLDGLSQAHLEALADKIEGYESLVHSTHSYRPPEKQNLRLVMPLSTAVAQKDWTAFWFSMVRWLGIDVDKKCKDPSRLYFLPRVPRGAPVFWERTEGQFLDPVKLLLDQRAYSKTYTPETAAPLEPGAVDLSILKKFLRGYAPQEDESGEKTELVRRFLAGESLSDIDPKRPVVCGGHPTPREPVVIGRDGAVHRVSTIIAWHMPVGTSPEAAAETMRESISKMPQYADDEAEEGLDFWMAKAVYGFSQSAQKRLEKIAENSSASAQLTALTYARQGVAAPAPAPSAPGGWAIPEPVARGVSVPVSASGAPPSPGVESAVAEPSEPSVSGRPLTGNWRLDYLKTRTLENGIIRTESISSNASAIFKHHPEWKGVLRYNELTNEPIAVGGPIPPGHRKFEQLVTATENWLQVNEDLVLPSVAISAQIQHVAWENRFDPVRDYLIGKCLPKWRADGEERLGTWLETYCGARIVDDAGRSVAEYVRLIGWKWMLAAVARALSPGCKADNVLILEGKTYKGKSMTLDILGGEWFSDTKLLISDAKQATEITSKHWIIELGELDSMRKTETAAQKAFFARKKDDVRFAYHRSTKAVLRRCVFAGTTEDSEYLLDERGNRRFWPFWGDNYDNVALRRDRDLLWGQATALFLAAYDCPACKAGWVDETSRCAEHRWWFDQVETAAAEVVVSSRLKNEFADPIRSWWLRREIKDRPVEIGMFDLARDVLGLQAERIDSYEGAVGRAMKRLNFTKRKKRVPGGKFAWVYVPPEELRTAPQVKEGSHLTLVEEPEANEQPCSD